MTELAARVTSLAQSQNSVRLQVQSTIASSMPSALDNCNKQSRRRFSSIQKRSRTPIGAVWWFNPTTIGVGSNIAPFYRTLPLQVQHIAGQRAHPVCKCIIISYV